MPTPDNGSNRLDRIEAIIEAVATRQANLEDEFARLLRAQVVMHDAMNNLAAEQTKLVEQQRHTEENLNALIAVVDDIVRRFPRTQ